MKKYLLIPVIFASFQVSFSQSNKVNNPSRLQIDSLNRLLLKLNGNKKVDCLNEIAYRYNACGHLNWKEFADSARPYAEEANKLAKKLGYKYGLGNSYLRLAVLDDRQFGYEKDVLGERNISLLESEEKNLRQAISIGEESDDYVLRGGAYRLLGWLREQKGDTLLFFNYLNKSIEYYEKADARQLKSFYLGYDYIDISKPGAKDINIGNIYSDLARNFYFRKNYSSSKIYFEKAINYFLKTGDNAAITGTYGWLSIVESDNFNADAAINYWKKALPFFQLAGDEAGEFQAYKGMAMICWNIGDFENGLEHAKKLVQLTEKFVKQNRKFDFSLGQSYFWMSQLYKAAGDYQASYDILLKAIPFLKDSLPFNDLWASSMGNIHRLMKNFDSAMYYAAKIKEQNPRRAMLFSHLYVDSKEYDKALPFVKDLIERTYKEQHRDGGNDLAYTIAASVYFGKNDYRTALTYAKKGLSIMKLANRKVLMVDNFQLLSDIFHGLGQNDSAYYYLKQYTILKDSLLNRQFLWKLNNYKREAEVESKTSQINLLNKDNQLKEQKLTQQAFIKNSLIAGLILLLLFGVFVFRTLTLKRKSALEKQRLESEKKQAELQQKATELEMQALRAQMNPHFIFNCLSSINKFILKNDTDAASDYLTRFSRLIRQVLTNSQLSLVPLSDEIEMLRLYLDMERLRFSESFDYNISYENTIEPEMIYIPPMLLQPFCENAIWHGLMHLPAIRKGRLEVQMSAHDGQLQCEITDNGVGRKRAAELQSKSGATQKSFGLKITTERLALFNNENAVPSFYRMMDSTDDKGNVAGTKVILNIKLKDAIPIQQTISLQT